MYGIGRIGADIVVRQRASFTSMGVRAYGIRLPHYMVKGQKTLCEGFHAQYQQR